MKRVVIALTVCAALSFVGCVDKEFNLAETSGEMTIGGEELLLPLGEIEKISLDDILGQTEGLTSNEDGVYQISFSSFGDDPTKYEKVSIDGISIPNITGLSPQLEPIDFSFGSLPTSLLFSAIEKPFNIGYPTNIGNVIQIVPMNITENVAFSLPSQLSGQGVIDDATLATLEAMQLSTISSSDSNEITFNATLEILEQLEKVDWVEFGCEEHPYGAPFNLKVDLKGLGDIVGGGRFKINIAFPDGYYLRDENGVDLAIHNIFSKEITLAAKQREIDITLLLHKIDYSQKTFTNGKLQINDRIAYSYEIDLNLGKGNYNLNSQPQITFQSEPKYKDVEIRINHFELPEQEYHITHSFNGMPAGVQVDKIAFTEDSKMNISLRGLEWCVVRDNLTNENISPQIEVKMPSCLHFRPHPLFDNSTNKMLASINDLSNGVELSLEYIDCTSGGGISQNNGQLLIDATIAATVHMESLDGHTILVSTITPPTDWNVTMGIAESRLNIDSANSVVVWSDTQSFDFNMDDNIPYISQTIDIPEMITEIKSIEIGKANSTDPLSMTFKLDAGTTFPVEELDIDVAVNLGKLLRPTQRMIDEGLITKSANGDYILSVKESWRPKQTSLIKSLEFDALENIPDIVNGKVTINQSFPVTGSVKIKSGESIDLSAVSDAKVNIEFNIDDIEVRSFTGKVDISAKPDNMFVEFEGISDLNLNIGSLNINPVLTLRLKDNPTGVGLNADVKVKTYNSTGEEITTLSVPTISIAGTGASTIVISTPRNASKYENEDVTFIAIDGLSQLLKEIPSKIGVEMEAYSNKDEEITIDLKRAANGYDIEYQYEVLLPFEFSDELDISYETTVSGLNQTFTTLADNTTGIKVGDIGLVAEFGTNIPFNIVISAELVNAAGTTEGISTRLNINDCVIKGYNKETDGEKKISNIDFDFDLDETHSFEGLRDADGVRIKLSIYDTGGSSAALAKDQFIDGKLKLRVRDGLTIDVFDFLKQEGE